MEGRALYCSSGGSPLLTVSCRLMRDWILLLGKDLIGVQNLLKKHQALQAEIAGHEPRIKAVTQKGNAMVEEGECGQATGPAFTLYIFPLLAWSTWTWAPSMRPRLSPLLMLLYESAQASPCDFQCHVSVLHIILPGHFAAEDVKAKLSELNQKWEALKAKASQRRQDLEDSLQAQQYFADANEAESWMREKEPIVGSTDYGKDEDSAEVAQAWPSHVLGKWAQP